MPMRLLIYIVCAYVIYKVVKTWLRQTAQPRVRKTDAPPRQAEDVMIQDPQCGIYFARRDGVPLTHEGRTLYFCSESCKEKFLAKYARTD
ncbi:MAG: YHS domain-containing protein [Desulfatitalea sp.]|nr:YHS domain-containing protein [Desulfatitalea sp.]